MKKFKRFLASMLCVVLVLTAAPLSGFVGLKFPEINLPVWNLFDFSIKSEALTEGIYIYEVTDGQVTITDCDTSVSDALVIPSTLGGYPVTRIGGSTFFDCISLTSVTIPDCVTSIGDYAFSGCTSLARVYYTGDIESWCGIEFGSNSANPMCYAKNFYINNTLVKEIVIPDTVTEIKNHTFYNFQGITSVTIPDSVTSIGDSAFSGCDSLTSITIPDSVTSIGERAFYYCDQLTSVTIGKGVTSIGTAAFRFLRNRSLTDVYYNGDIESWCKITFAGYYSNPMSYASNFYINGELVENLVIPQNTTSIKEYTFCSFDCIKTVTIPLSVITIQYDAFDDCYSIGTVYFEGTESQWEEIAIYDGNDSLKNSNVICLNGGHKHFYSLSTSTAPTCTESGLKTYKCSCGDYYTETIPATGHIWGKWMVATEPTATDYGVNVRVCTVCMDALDTEIIPATGSGDVTGSGITITLKDENGNVIIKEVLSDYNTDISFEDGTYTVEISKENYVSRTYTVAAIDNMMSLDFSLNKVGDMNGDGKVNTIDVARANAHAKGVSGLTGYSFDCVDINGDGRVNTIDVAMINSHAKGVKSLW